MIRDKINIAIAGFGNIGSYFYKTLEKNIKNIAVKTGKVPVVKYISAKNIKKKRKIKFPISKFVKNPLLLAKKKDVEIIIELIGGSDGIAKKLVHQSLKNKKLKTKNSETNKQLALQVKSELNYIKQLMINYECMPKAQIEELPSFEPLGSEYKRLDLWMPSPEFVQHQLDSEQGVRKMFDKFDFPIVVKDW